MAHEMERELTPVEARSGVISGRIFLILVVSSVAAGRVEACRSTRPDPPEHAGCSRG